LAVDVVIDADIKSIDAGGSRRLEPIVAVRIDAVAEIRHPNVIVEERLRHGIQSILLNLVSGKRRAGGGIDCLPTRQIRKVSGPHGCRWDRKYLRRGETPAVTFVVDEEKGLVPAVIKMRDLYRTAKAAAERVVGFVRFTVEPVRRSIECAVLQVFK